VPHDQQAIEQTKRDCRDDEQIHRRDAVGMIMKERLPLSLPQTPFGWRVTPNRVMLLLNERYFQADFAGGHRALPIKGFA
jgi:hypothetical protein